MCHFVLRHLSLERMFYVGPGFGLIKTIDIVISRSDMHNVKCKQKCTGDWPVHLVCVLIMRPEPRALQ